MRGATITCPKCATEMPIGFSFCGKCGARLLALAPVGGEIKQVTVLFADISGFTALAERLDPEELHENMRAAWDVIAVEIRASGGLIEKYIGDAVVAVFGAVDNEIDHPARAQRAALDILGALDRENERIAERTGRNLALRIGINTGLAVAGAVGDKESEFGVLGDAVNVAARLEQAAEPGEVLVGDATYRLAPGLFAYDAPPATPGLPPPRSRIRQSPPRARPRRSSPGGSFASRPPRPTAAARRSSAAITRSDCFSARSMRRSPGRATSFRSAAAPGPGRAAWWARW